jgi:hypothetical protein
MMVNWGGNNVSNVEKNQLTKVCSQFAGRFAATCSPAACFLLNVGPIPFSPARIYIFQNLIVPGSVAFDRKIAPENCEKMNRQAVAGIDGSSHDEANGSVQPLDMVEVGSGRVADFEIVRKANASGRGNFEGSSNRMEVEAMRLMVKGWEDVQKGRL